MPLRVASAVLIGAGILAAALNLSGDPGSSRLALSLTFGALFGFVLQRSRFCFFCLWRNLIDRRDPRGALGILAALAAGTVGYAVVLGAWLPDPSGVRLPPTRISVPSGRSSPLPVPLSERAWRSRAPASALISTASARDHPRHRSPWSEQPWASSSAFSPGTRSISPAFRKAPVIWLPRHLGYAGSLALTLAVLAALAVPLLRWLPPADAAPSRRVAPLRAVFVERWPDLARRTRCRRSRNLGVSQGRPPRRHRRDWRTARQAAAGLDLLPTRLEGLDGFRGCATAIRHAILTPNGVFIAGLVAASLAAALAAGEFRPALPTRGQAVRGLVGGLLLGWGAMTGLGCSVGTLLSESWRAPHPDGSSARRCSPPHRDASSWPALEASRLDKRKRPAMTAGRFLFS